MGKNYSKEEDKIIKSAYRRRWSAVEIAYRIHKELDIARPLPGVKQRISILLSEGKMGKRERGVSYITSDAVAWAKKVHNEKVTPSNQLQLREEAPAVRRSQRKKAQRKTMSAKEVAVYTKQVIESGGRKDTLLSVILRIQQENPDHLTSVLDVLEAAAREEMYDLSQLVVSLQPLRATA